MAFIYSNVSLRKGKIETEYAANFKMSMTISRGHPVFEHLKCNEISNYREDDQ